MKITLLLLIFLPLIGHTCDGPPDYVYSSAPELISRTDNIVLARVINTELLADDWSVLYRFEKIKQIKGRTESTFEIFSEEPYYEDKLGAFDDHRVAKIPDDFRGRLFNGADCEIHPSFDIGGTYLMFLDKPYHSMGFEFVRRITDGDDKDYWLEYVEKNVLENENNKSDYKSDDYQLFLVESGYEKNELNKIKASYNALKNICMTQPVFEPTSITFFESTLATESFVRDFYGLSEIFRHSRSEALFFLYKRSKAFIEEKSCIEKILKTIPTLDDFIK